MVVGILSEHDTWCLFLRYYSIVPELASHIFLQVSLVRLLVQRFYFSLDQLLRTAGTIAKLAHALKLFCHTY